MANTYYIDKIKYIDTYNLLDSGALHDSSHKLSGTTGNFETTGTIKAATGIFNELIATTLNARTATISELTAQNATVMGIMDVKGKLMTNSWEAANIASVGGNFYISPTGKDTGTPNVSITCNSVNSGAGTYTITVSKGTGTGQGNGFGVSSTSSSLWHKYSKVLMTGNVIFGNKKYPLGTLDGIIESITLETNQPIITSITLNSIISSALDLIFTEQSTIAVNSVLSGTAIGSNMQISLYQYNDGTNSSGFSYPIGIFLSSYGQTDKQQYIDIYSGSIKLGRNASDTANLSTGMAEPMVRIGQLDGLPDIKDGITDDSSPTKPIGWGIYTTNGFFKGKIVSSAGLIGGFNIGDTDLYNGSFGIDNSVWMSTGKSSSMSIGGSNNDNNWAFTAGSHFGVTTDGTLYANNANIRGTIYVGNTDQTLENVSGNLTQVTNCVKIGSGTVSIGNDQGFHIFIDGRENTDSSTYGLGFYQGPHTITNDDYFLTDDTIVEENKSYYELEDGVYTQVLPSGNENPNTEGWYEARDKRIAYINGQKLSIPYSVVLRGMDLGNYWRWELNETTRNLTLKWLG